MRLPLVWAFRANPHAERQFAPLPNRRTSPQQARTAAPASHHPSPRRIRTPNDNLRLYRTGAYCRNRRTSPPPPAITQPTPHPRPERQSAPLPNRRTSPQQAHPAAPASPQRIRTPNDNPHPYRTGAHRRNRRTPPPPPAITQAHSASAPRTTIRTPTEQAHIAAPGAHRRPHQPPPSPRRIRAPNDFELAPARPTSVSHRAAVQRSPRRQQPRRHEPDHQP